MPVRPVIAAFVAAALLAGCSSRPAAQVSSAELTTVRNAYASVGPGASETEVREAFEPAHLVKLGSASIGGVSVDEWKAEAFVENDTGRDMFIAFLYFCDGKLADMSDTRIDFRSKPELVDRWRSQSN